ncbi:phage major capsid protein [Mycobacterium avium]|uniref:phage major capsid protein n=1 Tax=Mycobacterium avium TaxID=1764 RepID=UPI0007A03D3D|nr:phage major capsid protein [Mycobacterium avium]MBZ4508385.1 phage major capsid protein [Mycobacterium avium subsp. hominissuis]MCA2295893.1 phage major capsid protein [Mycobacterium avium]WOF17898.1 phage major capsid protein [Mycobacterium avium]
MATTTTTTADYGWRPDAVEFLATDVVPTALIMQTTTIAGDVDGDAPSVHVPFIVDAGQTGTGAVYKAEGAALADEEPTLDEVELKTKKLTRLATLSNEMFNRAPTAAQVSASFARDLVRKADASFLGENTSPLIGLLHTAGVVEAPAPVAGSLDVLVDLLAELEVNGAEPTHIILDPLSWASVKKFKTAATYNSTLLGAGTEDAVPRLLSLPVLRSRFVPAHTGIVVDRTQIPTAVGQIKVAQSEHAAFTSDSVVLRATWRIGFGAIPRPERIGRFTVGDISSS